MEFILPIINAFEKQIMKLIPRFYNLIIEIVNEGDMRLGTYMKCNNSNNDEQLLVRALVELYEKCDINKSNYYKNTDRNIKCIYFSSLIIIE